MQNQKSNRVRESMDTQAYKVMAKKDVLPYQSKKYRDRIREIRAEHRKHFGIYSDSNFYKALRKYRHYAGMMSLPENIFADNFLESFVTFFQTMDKLGHPPKNLEATKKALSIYQSLQGLNTDLNFDEFTAFMDEKLSDYFSSITTIRQITLSTYHVWFSGVNLAFTKSLAEDKNHKWHTNDLKYVGYKISRWVFNKKYPV